jgi:hypothetical protein
MRLSPLSTTPGGRYRYQGVVRMRTYETSQFPGYVLVIDFDIATAWRTDHRGFVSPARLEGTLLYMAPEQTGRMNRATDGRADLYALGATLFEMLTGRPPFVDPDLLSIVHAHLAVRPPAPDAIDPELPRTVSAIVMKLLAKAPEDRYQTAEGLLSDLRTCAAQLATTGAIGAFALGRNDVADTLALPTRLYGRAEERRALAGAFERVCARTVETVLVAGPSGIGKTSVVRELLSAGHPPPRLLPRRQVRSAARRRAVSRAGRRVRRADPPPADRERGRAGALARRDHRRDRAQRPDRRRCDPRARAHHRAAARRGGARRRRHPGPVPPHAPEVHPGVHAAGASAGGVPR